MAEDLGRFIDTHREELLRRCHDKGATMLPATGPLSALEHGLPRFLDDLVSELSGTSKTREMNEQATRRGGDLFLDGVTSIGQVVHDYGSVCQSVTDLAVELNTTVSSEGFRTLNRCLDDAIAAAVSEYSRRQQQNQMEVQAFDQSLTSRNLIETAINGFEVLQSGSVGVGGTTGALVYRSLLALRTCIK
jgi:hypothetical protein